jgi:hypothetical protein
MALGLYAANSWVLKPGSGGTFFRGSFNDLLLIPAALPLVLEAQIRLGLRRAGRPPQCWETVFHLVIWGACFEWLGPWWFHRGTADVMDLVWYTAGALPSQWWWTSWERTRMEETPNAIQA